MSLRRRSARSAKLKVETFREASSEDEDAEGDEETKLKVKKAKLKLKEMMEDSDEASDFEKELKTVKEETSDEDSIGEGDLEEEDANCGLNNNKKRAPKRKMDGNKNCGLATKTNLLTLNSQVSSRTYGDSLQLSEDESSDDDSGGDRKRLRGDDRGFFRGASTEEDDDEADSEMMSQQTLLALAGNIQRINSSWQERSPSDNLQSLTKEEDANVSSTCKKSTKKASKNKDTPTSRSKPGPQDSIRKLLAAGEEIDGLDDSLIKQEHEDNDDKEEAKPGVSGMGVEINIQLPGHVPKKKKKGFDMEAFLKRELSKARRETQILIHQAHFVCLVTHLKYLNSVLNDPVLFATAMSVIPAAHSHPPGQITLTRLASLVSWLREYIPVCSGSSGELGRHSNRTFRERLKSGLESLVVLQKEELVCILVVILRVLGLDTRLVLNFNISPLKPPALDIAKDKALFSSKEVKKEDEKLKAAKDSKEGDKSATHGKDRKKDDTKLSAKDDKGKKVSLDKLKNQKQSRRRISVSESSDSEEERAVQKKSKESSKSVKSKSGSCKRKSSELSSSSKNGSKDKKDKSHVDKDKNGKSNRAHNSSRAVIESPMAKKSSDIRSSKDCGHADRKSASSRSRKSSGSLSAKLAESAARKSASKGTSSSKRSQKEESSSSQDDRPCTSSGRDKKKSSSGRGQQQSSRSSHSNYWVEVFLIKDDRWVTIDLETGKINSPAEVEPLLPKPVFYILAINTKDTIKDVTRRYCCNYNTSTRKVRYDEQWITSTLRPYTSKKQDSQDSKEELELTKRTEEAPMPTTVSAFKSHPLYVLERHLLKFEAIYPPDAPPLGWLKSEPVYARECVHTLQGRTSWLKEGKVVRIGEEPYKVVKARPKWDRMTGQMVKDEPLEVFGEWQTERYIPPPAKDGKVPRNEYGNVELFKPWMLPKGCVHIPISGMTRIIKKLGIDAAPAMVGWDFSGGGCHPMFDGYVVCEEFADTLMDAWNQEQELKVERAEEKREKRILDNWRKLIRGLLVRERIQAKYLGKTDKKT